MKLKIANKLPLPARLNNPSLAQVSIEAKVAGLRCCSSTIAAPFCFHFAKVSSGYAFWIAFRKPLYCCWISFPPFNILVCKKGKAST